MSALTAERLRIVLDGKAIVDDVNVRVESGQMWGLVGPNGAGKSTLMQALAGLYRPTSGDVLLGGDPVSQLSVRARARRMAYVPQDTGLDFSFTGREVVLMGRHPHVGRFEPLRLHDHNAADAALEATGASRFSDQLVPTLSGGERQLLHLAKALAQDTDVLLLDEPVAALDLRHQLQALSLLRRQTRARRDTAVVAVLHDLGHAARFCDRLALLAGGRLIAAGPPEAVLTEQLIAQAYGIRAAVAEDPATGTLRVSALDVL